jgi:hypothetical protein
MAPNGTPVYHDAADGFKPKTAKNPGFLLVFRNSRIRDIHVNDCIYAMNPAGTMPAASRQEGRAGDGARAWPNGPTRAAAGRRGGDAFLLNSPRSPDGGGGGLNTSRERSDPPLCFVRAASPPGDRSGAERPGGRARRPTDPARTARPIASGACCRHDAYSRRAGCWSGPAPRREGRRELCELSSYWTARCVRVSGALYRLQPKQCGGKFSQARDLAPQLRTFSLVRDPLRS